MISLHLIRSKFYTYFHFQISFFSLLATPSSSLTHKAFITKIIIKLSSSSTSFMSAYFSPKIKRRKQQQQKEKKSNIENAYRTINLLSHFISFWKSIAIEFFYHVFMYRYTYFGKTRSISSLIDFKVSFFLFHFYSITWCDTYV